MDSQGKNTSIPQTNDEWGAAWDRFLQSRTDSGFMQSYSYAQVVSEDGWGYFDAFLMNKANEIEGGGRVFIGNGRPGEVYFYMPDGPVLSKDEATAREQFSGMLAYIDEIGRQQTEKVTHLRLEPRWQTRPDFIDKEHEIDGWTEPRHTYFIDINKPNEDLLASMKYYGRYRVKKAIKLGVEIAQDYSSEGINDFIELYKNTANRKKIESVSSEYLRSVIKIFEPKNKCRLYFAEYNGVRLATALVIYFGDRVTYFFAGSNMQHSEVMAPYLLNFEIMVQAREMGYRWYDMYGIAPKDDNNHPLANVSQFKRKLGGEDRMYIPSLDFIYDEVSYREYRRSIQGT